MTHRLASLALLFLAPAGFAQNCPPHPVQKLVPESGDRFGRVVPVVGGPASAPESLVLCGDEFSDRFVSFAGMAVLFDADTGERLWTFRPDTLASFDRFGAEVAIDGTTLFVSAITADFEVGTVHVFDSVSQTQIDEIPGDPRYLNFGYDLAVGDANLAIGALTNGGAVFVYDKATRAFQYELLGPPGGNSAFGVALAMDDGLLVVGDPFDDQGSPDAGAVFVHDAATGAFLRKIVASDAQNDDFFGFSVALENGVLAVGARNEDERGHNAGAVYLFDVATGNELFKCLADAGQADDALGTNVALSSTELFAGTFSADVNQHDQVGAVVVFDVATGQQSYVMRPDAIGWEDRFGSRLSLTGSSLAVLATGDDDAGPNAGAIYVMDLEGGARVTSRNGSGLNAERLAAATGPQLGASWDLSLDFSGVGPGTATLLFHERPSSGRFFAGGELLLDPASSFLAKIVLSHTGGVRVESLPVPLDPALCGANATLQAAVFGATGYELTNALDLIVGT